MDLTSQPDPRVGTPDRNAGPGGMPVPAAPEVPGYRVVRLLGLGGSAAVWLVRTPEGAPYALKVPAGRGGAAMNAFEARREVNILARLEHANLLRLHGVVETDHGAALLSGYAPGGSAAGLVEARGPLPPGETVSVLVGIAAALGYLHSQGTAHGDVSPGNILFTAEGRPLLADFGSGRLLGEPGVQRPGTPGFQAPESTGAAGTGLGTAGDIFALAAVGWFLLTGRVPPPTRERPPLSILVPDVGRELPAVLEAGLAEDPAERPTAEEFAAAAYRGAPALPVDLVAAVHPEVHPELLTRRTGSAASGSGGRRRWWQRRVPVVGPRREPAPRGGLHRGRLPRARGRSARDWTAGDTAAPDRSVRDRALLGRTRGGSPGDVAAGEVTVGHVAGERRERSAVSAGRNVNRPAGRRRRAGNPFRSSRVFPIAATGVVVAVLILAAIALAAPDVLRAGGDADRTGDGSAGSSRSPGSPPGTSTAPPAAAAPSSGAAGVAGRAVQAKSVESLRAETAAEDPAQALPALAELRSRAFSSADTKLLQLVDAPDSEALLADQEQVGRLAAEGHVLVGLDMSVSVLAGRGGTTQPADGAPTAELRVRMQVSPYTQVDGEGAELRREQAQEQEVLLLLVRSGGTWLISRVMTPD